MTLTDAALAVVNQVISEAGQRLLYHPQAEVRGQLKAICDLAKPYVEETFLRNQRRASALWDRCGAGEVPVPAGAEAGTPSVW